MPKVLFSFESGTDSTFAVPLILNDTPAPPIKFCVNNNLSSNNKTADYGVIRLSELPRVNFSFLSAECFMHALRE